MERFFEDKLFLFFILKGIGVLFLLIIVFGIKVFFVIF